MASPILDPDLRPVLVRLVAAFGPVQVLDVTDDEGLSREPPRWQRTAPVRDDRQARA